MKFTKRGERMIITNALDEEEIRQGKLFNILMIINIVLVIFIAFVLLLMNPLGMNIRARKHHRSHIQHHLSLHRHYFAVRTKSPTKITLSTTY
jgi:hypothetical protein